MLDRLTFGWRTAVLSVAVVQLVLLAAALARTMPNRAANRTLAALLGVLALMVMPWLIGFAGFYDKWMLPQSGLEFDLPIKGYYPERPQPDAGVAPDIAVRTSAADIAAGYDRVLETARKVLLKA